MFHSTGEETWAELLNIAGANAPGPKMVCEMVATDDYLAYMCLQKKIPYLGVCFNDYHRQLLRKRLAQRVFESMRSDDESMFGTKAACQCIKKIWAGRNADGINEGNDDDEEDAAEVDADPAQTGRGKGKGKGKKGKAKAKSTPEVSRKRQRRQSKKFEEGDDDQDNDGEAAGPAAKRAALLDKLNSKLEGESEDDVDVEGDHFDDAE